MIQSMTGFGSAQRGNYKVDVRSLNSKYIDIHCRLPQSISHFELNIRKSIKDRFSRGKFDVYVQETKDLTPSMRLNEGIIPAIESSITTLKERIGYSGEISIDTLLLFKDMLFVDEQQTSEEDFLIALDEALGKLFDMRYLEGKSIVDALIVSLQKMSDTVNKIESIYEGFLHTYKERLISRIKEVFNQIQVDEARVYQEAVMMAIRSDIKEEISRLKSHIKQFSLSLNNDTVGKKLEFLAQEMLRETNTISQKIDEINIINCTIELKTEIDRIKEQVQNIQ